MTELADKCRAFLLDIVFPNRCAVCGKFIMWNENLCTECNEKFPVANSKICRKCGKLRCTCKEKNDYDMAFATFFFKEKLVRNAILRFKINGETGIAEYTARDIAFYMDKEKIPRPDIVVPVPMGKRKRLKRGHNQAELLAKCIGKRLGIPVNSRILFKYDTEDEQHNYGRKERKKRVKTLFYTKNADLTGMTVLLCDDVMTTGSTADKCAMLLKNLGAKTVIFAVCAVTEY